MRLWAKRTFLLSVRPLKGALGVQRGERRALTRLKMAPLGLGHFTGGSGKLKTNEKRRPARGLKSKSSKIGHFRGYFDRLENANGR